MPDYKYEQTIIINTEGTSELTEESTNGENDSQINSEENMNDNELIIHTNTILNNQNKLN